VRVKGIENKAISKAWTEGRQWGAA